MDKAAFVKAFSLNTESYTLPNGETVILRELNAGQRSKLNTLLKNNVADLPVAVVTMSLDFISDEDTAAVAGLPSGDVEKMAERVLSLSGLSDSEDAEKN